MQFYGKYKSLFSKELDLLYEVRQVAIQLLVSYQFNVKLHRIYAR